MSINLVPQEIKDRIVARQASYKVIMLYVFLLVILGLGVIWLMTVNVVKQGELSNINSELENTIAQSKENRDLLSKAAFIDNRLQSAATYRETMHWDETLSEIAASTPSRTQITSLKIVAGNTTTVSINGKSASAREAVLFRDKLATISGFSKPVITSINESETVGDSEFTFTLEATYTSKTGGAQ